MKTKHYFVMQQTTAPFLSPNSDKNEISSYMITACSNIQVMRMKETITKDKMSS